MKKNVNVFSIISLIISIIATGMFWMLLGKVSKLFYFPWVVLGTICFFFPLLSKYFRKRADEKGKVLEIIALILGFYNFWWVLSVRTELNTFFILIICIIPCVLYAKLFNKILPVQKEENAKNIITTKKSLLNSLTMISFILSCICILFLIIHSAIVTSEPDMYLNWSLIFGFYIIPIILFVINLKKSKAIISIIIFCIMTFYAVMAGIMTDVGEAFDYSVESIVVFYALLFITFLLAILSFISIFKAKWNFGFYYNSMRYRTQGDRFIVLVKKRRC